MAKKSYCFLSNYLTHHQLPFCLEMMKLTDGNFKFIETESLPSERTSMGYKRLGEQFDFVVSAYKDAEKRHEALNIAKEADVAIIGSAPDVFIKERLKENKLTFRYSERIFKKGYFDLLRQIKYIFKNFPYRNKNLYYLLSSAYAAHDYKRCGVKAEKMFKWGYFPELKKYQSIDDIIDKKEENSILWTARFIDWKHPEIAIELAHKLKQDGLRFKLRLIGTGEKESEIRFLIEKYDLKEYVMILGPMSPEKVREQMENHQIFLFTSDFNEGWGAVLNEAMNSGCVVVASHAAGSVPYMIENGENGFIYENEDVEALYSYVKRLIEDDELSSKIGERAFETVKLEWNAQNAAKKLVCFCNRIESEQFYDFTYESGLLSAALAIAQSDMFQRITEGRL